MNIRRTPSLLPHLMTFLAILVVVSCIGAPLPSNPLAPVAIVGPTKVSSNGRITAIVVEQARKVLLVNNASRLVAYIDLESFESPIEVATDVCVGDDRVYVAGFKGKASSDYIESERVLVYDVAGNRLGVTYETQGLGTTPRIIGLEDGLDGLMVIKRGLGYSEDDRSVVLLANEGGVREVAALDERSYPIDASLTPTMSRVVTLSERGVINDGAEDQLMPDGHTVFSATALSDDGDVFATDAWDGSLCRIGSDGNVSVLADGTTYDKLDIVGHTLSAIDGESGKTSVMDLDGRVFAEYDQAGPSAYVAMRVALWWACALFLAVRALVLLVKGASGIVAQDRARELLAPLVSVVTVMTLAIALGHNAAVSYETQLRIRGSEVNAYAEQVNDMLSLRGDSLTRLGGRKAFIEDDSATSEEELYSFGSLFGELLSICRATAKNGIDLYFVVYGMDDQGLFSLLSSHDEYRLGESVHDASNYEQICAALRGGEVPKELQAGTTRYESTLYRLLRVNAATGEGMDVVVELGSRMRSFESAAMRSLLRNGLALVVMLLTIYMGYMELREGARCVIRYQRMRRKGEDGAISALARPFALLSMMLAGVDGVMGTLIAKDLLGAMGMADDKSLVLLPAIMLGVGQAIGQGIYGRVGSKTGLRKIVVRGSSSMLVCALLTGTTVFVGSFWAYCAAKLLLAIPFGLLYTAAYSLRRHAVTSEQSRLAKNGVKRSNTSSAALGTALGGYAAQLLGNAFVYFVMALVCVAVLVMAAMLIPEGVLPPEEEREFSKQERSRMRAFILRPRTVVIVACVIFPSVIVTGYASTVFPLFSAQLGFEKGDISNMYLLGQSIVYVSIFAIERYTKSVGNWKAALHALAGLGLVFLAFSINTTVVWGVVVIVLVGLLVKMANVWKPLWLAEAKSAEVPAGWATGAMFVIRSAARIAKPFLLSGLLMVSGQDAVFIIGSYCALCAIVIAWTCKAASRTARCG